nr:MAG TPA: hypothetical protein [Caudoviricetes sp.]
MNTFLRNHYTLVIDIKKYRKRASIPSYGYSTKELHDKNNYMANSHRVRPSPLLIS